MPAVTINTNVASLQTQRRLSENTAALNRSFQHLSSGQRITRASEDAAGLAIATGLNTDSRVYNQGVRNFNDGISALSIADGAVSELTNIVIRLQELAEQAANGTLGASQRSSLDAEAQALGKEYLRIAQTTSFNGQKLLDGTVQGLALQGGYGANGTLVASFGGKIGTGNFQAVSNYGAGLFTKSVALGDLNGDGILDMVTGQYGSVDMSVMIGNGDGTFKARVSYGSASSSTVTIGDVNGDGTLDVVAANYSSGQNTVAVFIGNGDGTFRARISSLADTNPYALSLGDLNGDGYIDMATADTLNGEISVLMGNGNGTFKARTDYSTGGGVTNPTSIAMGDFDRDGILDLATNNYNSTTSVSVFLGIGNGTFKTRVDYNTGASGYQVAIGDLNGDQILDLATADAGASTTSVLLGNGNGSFKASISYVVGASPWCVALGDMNGDGFLDLVSTNQGPETVSLLLNNGDGTFKAKTDFATASDPSSVKIGDLNGDGVPDLAVAAGGTSIASVLLAQTQDGVAPLLDFSLKTQAGARQSLSIFKNAVKNIAAQRGTIGAGLSRADFATSVIRTSSEVFTAAESQIRDADIAYETANLARLKILQQASTSVLAQANLQPKLALSLVNAG